eukprot:scaffold350_cov133-Cylindrotheca_fusiformis.AAC.8
MSSHGEVDERIASKSALEAAEEQLRSLCASHAGTFVSVERRGYALEVALKDLLASVKNIELFVSSSQNALDQEEESDSSLAALSEKHRVRRRTLLQHSSLLELLELPSLMDACVRSNLYEEALSIAAFANTLERRHAERNEVVLKVIVQVRSRQVDLRRHLLFCLKNHVSMPQCLEIVTALRRLNSIDLERQSEANLERVHAAMELRLQVDFLEARDAWLDIPGSNSAPFAGTEYVNSSSYIQSEQLLDVIERHRTRMFEIETQFNAIFRVQANAEKNSVSLLSMWASRRVHSFLSLLAIQLNQMQDSASLRDALDSCIFFSASMGRLGADFTSQVPPLFEKKILSLVTSIWGEGVGHLADTLKICRDAGVASPLSSSAINSSVSLDIDSSSLAPLPPPRELMALPPLGRLVNAFLNGLNELRRCLLPGIFPLLRKSLAATLAEVNTTLQANERLVLTPGLRGDATELRECAKAMKEAMKKIVTPYMKGVFEDSLGNTKSARDFYEVVLANTAPKLTSMGSSNVDKEGEEDNGNPKEVKSEEGETIEKEENIAEEE